MTYYTIITFLIISYYVTKRIMRYSKITIPEKELESTETLPKWKTVYSKTNTWTEYGFGDGDLFPGFGKLYQKEYDVWYSDFGSLEKKETQKFSDKSTLNRVPRNISKITGDKFFFDRVGNGPEVILSGLDPQNKRRWYFKLIEKKPLWIETKNLVEMEYEKAIEASYNKNKKSKQTPNIIDKDIIPA